MDSIQIFTNEEFGTIRTLVIDNETMFVGKDVADILGYQNSSRDINRHVDAEDRIIKTILHYQNGTSGQNHVDNEDKLTERIVTSGQNRETILINESGLYSLILSSKLPNAKRFKRWVTSEVLPSVRKNGGYLVNQENLSPEQILANAIKVAERIIEDKNKLIEEMTPKALFADSVSCSDATILIGDLAKILRGNGVLTGSKRLFQFMRDNGYLIKRKGSEYNMPTQRSMELGLFKIKETAVTHSDGHTSVIKTTKVTGKGQQYFINLMMKKEPERWRVGE